MSHRIPVEEEEEEPLVLILTSNNHRLGSAGEGYA